MQRLRVAVVRGGEARAFESSLKCGETILKALRDNDARYSPVDIFVDKTGIWHMRGLPVDPGEALKHVDLVWNVSRGSYLGGRLEQLLEAMKIPHVGSSAMAGAFADSIHHTRETYTREKLPTIRYKLLTADTFTDTELLYIFRNFLHPVTVRTEARDSGFVSRVVHGYHELECAVRDALTHGSRVVVEEYMKGKEALAGVLENARGERLYALLPAEFRSNAVVVPGNFSPLEKHRIEALAKRAHQALGLKHYSATRFLVTPRGAVYIIETHALPDISHGSPFGKSLEATGWGKNDFVEHLVSQVVRS